jgi:hypothetical protein
MTEAANPAALLIAAPDETKGKPQKVSPIFGFLIWLAIVAFFAWHTDTGNAFLRNYWWTVLCLAAAGALVLMVPAMKAQFAVLTLEARTAIIVFAVLPAIVLLFAGVVLLQAPDRVVAMRGVFLAVVVLLPGTMYYLFIVTRKDSLLNEYITILDRLGLTTADRLKLNCEQTATGSYELLLGPRLRIETYLQRFEAAYGPIGVDNREEYITMLVRGFDPAGLRRDRPLTRRQVGFTEVFNFATAVPVIVATALIALGWLMILPPIPVKESPGADGLINSLNPAAGPVGFAFLGAYFFALQALFRRYLRRDLRAGAYVSISIRVVLAVVGTWVAVQCAKVLPASVPSTEDTLIVVGFALGVFPQVAWQFVRKVMSKITFADVALPSLQSQLPLSDLDGLTVWHESRLEEEDIENVANMATTDLSDLMLNTRIARNRLVDWVDQAMLYVQIGPEAKEPNQRSARELLRDHGIRTATSLLLAYDRSKQQHQDQAAFEQLLADAGAGKRQRLRTLVDAIETAPNLAALLTWKGIVRPLKQTPSPAAV